MMPTRKVLTGSPLGPLDNFIFRLAWFELNGMAREAEALRTLAADFRPPYRVNETLIAQLPMPKNSVHLVSTNEDFESWEGPIWDKCSYARTYMVYGAKGDKTARLDEYTNGLEISG